MLRPTVGIVIRKRESVFWDVDVMLCPDLCFSFAPQLVDGSVLGNRSPGLGSELDRPGNPPLLREPLIRAAGQSTAVPFGAGSVRELVGQIL